MKKFIIIGSLIGIVALAIFAADDISPSDKVSISSSRNQLKSITAQQVADFAGLNAGTISVTNSLTTGDPTSGTKQAWKLGSVHTGVTVALTTTNYVEVEINGAAVKIGIVQ